MKTKPEKQKLVVLTGAGMSAESGVATFRDSGGLWEEHRMEDVATPEAFRRNPELVLDFYNQRRHQLLEVEPNMGHKLLVELEQQYDVYVITQNVDNLHERAGSSNVLHLHGELVKVRSTGPGEEIYELNTDNYQIKVGNMCPKGYQLRPHIVWFGEAVPEFENAIKTVEQADFFLIIGSSLQVYPVAGLVHYVKPEVPIYLIDPNDVEQMRPDVKFIKKGAVEGMKELLTILNIN